VKGDDIAERLLDFAVEVLRLVKAIKKQPNGGNAARQLERCGPAAGSNYEEARAAESRADFIHKLSVATKEMRESLYWIRVAKRAELAAAEDVAAAEQEANELTAILMRCVRTARQNVGRIQNEEVEYRIQNEESRIQKLMPAPYSTAPSPRPRGCPGCLATPTPRPSRSCAQPPSVTSRARSPMTWPASAKVR